MGNRQVLTPESPDIISEREVRSHTIAECRDRKRDIYIKMLKRVLQAETKEKSQGINL